MYSMFHKPPHDTATRRGFLGLFEETTPLSPAQSELFQNIDKALTTFGQPFADQVKVTELKFVDGTIKKTDQYTINRPSIGQRG